MTMKKFINKPEDLMTELLEGLALAHSDILEVLPNNLVVSKALKDADRVTIVTLGGTGHEPALEGFVGDGMVDIAAAGDIFAAPGPQACVEAIKMADKGHGVLFVVLNHAGDMLSANLAMKECHKLGLNVAKVVTQEDIMNAPREEAENRRGFVGCCAVYKIACAAAKEGKTLEEVAAIAQDFADNMAAVSVAAKIATHPSTGSDLGEIADDVIGIGMGQHGEGGGDLVPIKPADEVVATMSDMLIKDLDLKSGEKIMVFVNGSGATTLMEMLICYRAAVKHLETKGITVVANWVDEILTVQECAGFQLFYARMNEDYLRYWNAPCYTAYNKK